MVFNPLDYKVQDVKVVHAGLYVGHTVEGSRLKINATDLPNIKGGMFAAINGAGELNICNGDTETPIGMFYGDGAKEPKRLTVIMRGGIYMIKNFDTTDIANMTNGTKLVVNTAGKVKSQGMSTNDVVAIVLKAAADVDDFLGIKLLI